MQEALSKIKTVHHYFRVNQSRKFKKIISSSTKKASNSDTLMRTASGKEDQQFGTVTEISNY